jgi:ribosomal protein L37AE/L43A
VQYPEKDTYYQRLRNNTTTLTTYYFSIKSRLTMALQASSVLSSVPEQDWSDIDPALRPFTSSSVAPSTIADGDGDAEVNEGEKLTYKRTSEVWDHSFYSRHKITRNSKGQSIWRCKYCSKTYVDTGGTGNAKAHLVKHHSRQIQTQNEKRIKGYQQTIDMAQFRAQSDAANHKRRRLDIRDEGDNERGQGSELDPAVLEQLYVAWITTCGWLLRWWKGRNLERS